MFSALVGGVLIGLAATMLLFTHGKVAGVGSIFGGAVTEPAAAGPHRAGFLAGLVASGAIVALAHPAALGRYAAAPVAVAAGLLVGFGVSLGAGCTSGHGVCGTSRLSPRSIAATLAFMLTGAASVFVVRHVLGGAR